MSDQHPVYVAVRRPDGSSENVRVGTATRAGDGFVLQLGELQIGGQPVAARPAQASAAPVSANGLPTVLPNYGRAKGAPIAGASQGDLEYYANGARRSLGDPSKSRWHDKERALLQAIEAELQRQGGGGGPPPDENVPEANGDQNDIPF